MEIRNYSTRYREGLDLVLQGISASIQPGEKVRDMEDGEVLYKEVYAELSFCYVVVR